MKRYFQLFFVLFNLFLFTSAWAVTDADQPIAIKILGVNDFHGQISAGRKINNRPVGSAPVLASYLKEGKEDLDDHTLVAFSGDLVGASTPASGLLNHEPSILFLNTLGNAHCTQNDRMNPKCNLVATPGNHEFDRGQQALFDLIYGSHAAPTRQWVSLDVYPGASFPYVSANIVHSGTGQLLFPPYIIKEIQGVKIAFIGAILKNANEVALSKNIEGITFLDEVESINRYAREAKNNGADVVVVIIHQGGTQTPYEGPTHTDETNNSVTGPIVPIVNHLNDDVDVVMAAHYHLFINAYLPNEHGKRILVTEANSYSTSFAEITLSLAHHAPHSVLSKSARIITTYADEAPGTTPDAKAAEIVRQAENNVLPIVNETIGTLQEDLLKVGNSSGESRLGDLVADAFRNILHTDFGIMNPGGLRADLFAGVTTWGSLYAVEPFSNAVGTLTLTGQDIYDLLEQQWGSSKVIMLQISGLRYSYDLSKPVGHRILTVLKDQIPLQRDGIYTISTNEFLAGGGDGFTVMQRGVFVPIDKTDLEVLIEYIQRLPQPFTSVADGRLSQAVQP